MNHETYIEHDQHALLMESFKIQSLEALRTNLANNAYPNYPDFKDRLWADGWTTELESLVLPLGAWETSDGATPTISEQLHFSNMSLLLDTWGRPIHPWFNDMLGDPKIGVLTGKGAYWNWGPNYTADSIVVRHDLAETHVLLIERSDTGQWALPGGFIDKGEESLIAALRETNEETGLDLSKCNPAVTQIYSGPLADIRVTANAWPETTAFRFDLLDTTDIDDIQGADDANSAAWIPVSKIDEQMFGSHRLLIELALNTTESN